jgi:hypothetical protein
MSKYMIARTWKHKHHLSTMRGVSTSLYERHFTASHASIRCSLRPEYRKLIVQALIDPFSGSLIINRAVHLSRSALKPHMLITIVRKLPDDQSQHAPRPEYHYGASGQRAWCFLSLEVWLGTADNANVSNSWSKRMIKNWTPWHVKLDRTYQWNWTHEHKYFPKSLIAYSSWQKQVN